MVRAHDLNLASGTALGNEPEVAAQNEVEKKPWFQFEALRFYNYVELPGDVTAFTIGPETRWSIFAGDLRIQGRTYFEFQVYPRAIPGRPTKLRG